MGRVAASSPSYGPVRIRCRRHLFRGPRPARVCRAPLKETGYASPLGPDTQAVLSLADDTQATRRSYSGQGFMSFASARQAKAIYRGIRVFPASHAVIEFCEQPSWREASILVQLSRSRQSMN